MRFWTDLGALKASKNTKKCCTVVKKCGFCNDGDTFRIYSEAETPDIGTLFRARDDGTNTEANPGFAAVKNWLINEFRVNQLRLAQESDMV